MTLQRLLFEPTLVRSPGRVIKWWESRRPVFNLMVGVTGLGTLVYTSTLSWLARGEWMWAPWQLIVAYGLAANLCYTLGWAVELFMEKWLERPVYGLGPALFRHGLVFSLGLTLFPAGLVTVLAVVGQFFKP